MPEPGQPKTDSIDVTSDVTRAPGCPTDLESAESSKPYVPTADETAIPFDPPQSPGEIGRLSKYAILRELGHGGMGAVYLAVDQKLNRKLAIKVMLPRFAARPEARDRFLREARLTASINHDHIVTIYEADEWRGIPFIAMEYLKGLPLNEYLRQKKPIGISQAIRVGREIAAGLGAAHKRGLIHRDIKPANLWLEAPNGRVKILDFGLAKPVDAAGERELTKDGAIIGTPSFMAPEQAEGLKVDHRADLFSFGIVLYRLLAGRMPFAGESMMAVLIALSTKDPAPLRELNPQVPEPL